MSLSKRGKWWSAVTWTEEYVRVTDKNPVDDGLVRRTWRAKVLPSPKEGVMYGHGLLNNGVYDKGKHVYTGNEYFKVYYCVSGPDRAVSRVPAHAVEIFEGEQFKGRLGDLRFNTLQAILTNHKDVQKFSDGYHTFADLYQHRQVLWIALCRNSVGLSPVWRSRIHSDGSAWDGWFLMGIGKDAGSQMTYHLPDSAWEDCGFAETLHQAPDFDGHTPEMVLSRLGAFNLFK